MDIYPKNAATMVKLLAIEARMKSEQERKDIAAWRQKHYTANKTQILEILNEALKEFSVKDRAKMQKMFLTLLRKIIRRSSMVLKKPPERKILNSKGEVNEVATEEYKAITRFSNMNAATKSALYLAKLHNTILTRPFVRGKQLKYLNLTPDVCGVVENAEDYLVADAVYYDVMAFNTEGIQILKRVVWTAEQHYSLIGTDGKKEENDLNDANPYGDLIFATLRLCEDSKTFWGTGADDLVMSIESLMAMVVNLIEVILMQGNDIGYAVNMQLTQPHGADKEKKKLVLGLRRFFSRDGVGSHEADPKIGYASPSPEIEEMRLTIDWLIGLAAATKGLPRDSFGDQDAKVESGIAKVVESSEMLEDREDDEGIIRIYEQELYEKTALVANKELGTHLPPVGFM